MTFWRSQFDKILMAGLAVFFTSVALGSWGGTEVKAFALQSAGVALGCIITLVTGRRPAAPDPSLDPTSASTTTTTVSKTETLAPPPPTVG